MNYARRLLRHVGYVYIGVGIVGLIWMEIQPNGFAVLAMMMGFVGLCCAAISLALPRGLSRHH